MSKRKEMVSNYFECMKHEGRFIVLNYARDFQRVQFFLHKSELSTHTTAIMAPRTGL